MFYKDAATSITQSVRDWSGILLERSEKRYSGKPDGDSRNAQIRCKDFFKTGQHFLLKSVIFVVDFINMKKHILTIISLIIIVLAFSSNADGSLLNKNYDTEDSYVFDRQQSDIEFIFNNDTDNTIIPELQNTIPSPSFRLISSQKKTQQNLINNILLKRFSSEVEPTKSYNIKFSSPLSSKDDLIVIIRHLII